MRRISVPLGSPLAVILVAIVVTACGSSQGRDGADAPTRVTTSVEVQNNNWLDMVIYAVRSGSRVRLGMVNSMNSASFRLPIPMAGSGAGIRLEAHPIGSRTPFQTPLVHVSPGQVIDFTIQNHLAISTVSVW